MNVSPPLAASLAEPLLEVRALTVDYPVRRSAWSRPHWLRAVREVSFDLAAGETLGIVGESGCGKSTLARALAGMVQPSGGSVRWAGRDVARLASRERRAQRREVQLIFQDPAASLDPRMRVADLVAEPLGVPAPAATEREKAGRVAAMLERVGLSMQYASRFPHELSGGQCQRVAIARALVSGPRLLICDEPVSALDVSVQAQIINLLRELQRDLGLSMLFVSHNLAVVRQVSARVLVMYLGRVMELGPRDAMFAMPRHPYTRALLAAIPSAVPTAALQYPLQALLEETPSPLSPPSGCVFNPRCPWVVERCRQVVPALDNHGTASVACHRWRELPAL